jgi:hypothetical protein
LRLRHTHLCCGFQPYRNQGGARPVQRDLYGRCGAGRLAGQRTERLVRPDQGTLPGHSQAAQGRLGDVKLRELTARDVQETLDALAGWLSTRSLQVTRLCPERAIRHAEVRDPVGRNVAALIKAPAGRAGRPSKGLTLR